MPIALRVTLALGFLVVCVVYVTYFIVILRGTRIQAETELDYGRALRSLPKEVRVENQAAMARRAVVMVALFLGTLVVGGVVTMITGSPGGLVIGPVATGLVLLILGMLTSAFTMALDLGRRYFNRPDPGPVLIDLGVSKHGPAAVRDSALAGLAFFLSAVMGLLKGNWAAALFWGVFALLIVGSKAAALGRTQLTERGLWKGTRFWTWSQFVRRVWSDDGRCVAVMRSGTQFQVPWLLLSIPDGLRDDVEAVLRQHLPGGDGPSPSPVPHAEARPDHGRG